MVVGPIPTPATFEIRIPCPLAHRGSREQESDRPLVPRPGIFSVATRSAMSKGLGRSVCVSKGTCRGLYKGLAGQAAKAVVRACVCGRTSDDDGAGYPRPLLMLG